MIDDTIGAFCPHGRFELEGAAGGALHGLDFAVKDVIDIAGHITGAGNPRWLATHAAAMRNAACVDDLLAAGARLVGKTVTDELAYSLHGDNVHYGTPVNVTAPGRVPGGSSSGSAAAVAAQLCDFALGTDSGGSVRVPASYCGIYGIRTTHGLIPLGGVIPFMPSFDTLGWFARGADLCAEIGAVLLPPGGIASALDRMVVAADAFGETEDGVADVLAPVVAWLGALFPRRATITLADEGLERWRTIYRTVSAEESWRILGPWIEQAEPDFAVPIAERFAWAKSVTAEAASDAAAARAAIAARIRRLVGADTVLCIPSTAGPAPRLDARSDEIEHFRQSVQRLTCIAGMAGLPQISLPLASVAQCPVGLSLIGPAGSDAQLLQLAARIEDEFSGAAENFATERFKRASRQGMPGHAG